jgi:uncharacterized HAD superfamily protein
MKISPHQIGFDIDGVVADTMEAFIRLADQDYAIKVLPAEITDFMVEDCLDMDPEIIDDIFTRLMVDPLGTGLKPMENAIPVLEKLSDEAPLTFITARPDHQPIHGWLKHYLSPEAFASARLVATGDHDDKAGHIKRLGLTHFVDDRTLTCHLLAREEDIIPIVYSQPWNIGTHDHFFVENWESIARLCSPV